MWINKYAEKVRNLSQELCSIVESENSLRWKSNLKYIFLCKTGKRYVALKADLQAGIPREPWK